jgi:hypothetical protein
MSCRVLENVVVWTPQENRKTWLGRCLFVCLMCVKQNFIISDLVPSSVWGFEKPVQTRLPYVFVELLRWTHTLTCIIRGLHLHVSTCRYMSKVWSSCPPYKNLTGRSWWHGNRQRVIVFPPSQSFLVMMCPCTPLLTPVWYVDDMLSWLNGFPPVPFLMTFDQNTNVLYNNTVILGVFLPNHVSYVRRTDSQVSVLVFLDQ